MTVNTTNINPKILGSNLTTLGNWTVIINNNSTSTTSLLPFNIIVQTDQSVSSCVNFCSNIPNTLGLVPNTNSTCYCITGYQWSSLINGCVVSSGSCPITTPFISPSTGLCISSCPSGYYPNVIYNTCTPCKYTCETCTNSTNCASCSAINSRYFVANECVPMSGYYESLLRNAAACVSPYETCSSSTVCITCLPGFYMNVNTCISCTTFNINCTTCNASGCLVCAPGSLLSSGLCISVCGDAILVGS